MLPRVGDQSASLPGPPSRGMPGATGEQRRMMSWDCREMRTEGNAMGNGRFLVNLPKDREVAEFFCLRVPLGTRTWLEMMQSWGYKQMRRRDKDQQKAKWPQRWPQNLDLPFCFPYLSVCKYSNQLTKATMFLFQPLIYFLSHEYRLTFCLAANNPTIYSLLQEKSLGHPLWALRYTARAAGFISEVFRPARPPDFLHLHRYPVLRGRLQTPPYLPPSF